MTKRKIAIVGTGMGGDKAPYGNPDYEIWGITGLWNSGKKFDRIYEVHSAKALTEEGAYTTVMAKWMSENITHIHPTLQASFPNAKVIDFEGHLRKFGKYFTSSFSWMLADAIEEKVDVIETYGFTLSSNSEYAHQKPGASYLIGWARASGIEVKISKESELLSTPFIYGYEDMPDMIKSITDRKKASIIEMEKAEMQVFDAKAKYHHLEGVKETLTWFENNFWAGK